ncbi:MAG: hypothetical protein K6T86_00235 [Pirellulales bacterium]|nr:hypothetical protein [Pirellulales bacterium]
MWAQGAGLPAGLPSPAQPQQRARAAVEHFARQGEPQEVAGWSQVAHRPSVAAPLQAARLPREAVLPRELLLRPEVVRLRVAVRLGEAVE